MTINVWRFVAVAGLSVSASQAQAPGSSRPDRSGLRLCGHRAYGPRARCGSMMVYENREAGSGRQININFLVLKAARPTHAAPLILFDGGPGAGSTDLAELANGPLAPIRKFRDILMVDQRGTGRSNGLLCPTAVVTRPAVAFSHVFDPEVFRTCRRELETRADLTLYTTERAIEDVDDVRQALGYDSVLVWGGSYGTRMAQAYLRRYPTRVVAAVLDGVVPFDFHAPAGYARSLQGSLDRVMADCREWPACRDSFPSLAQDFASLTTRLRDGPVPATVKRRDGKVFPVTLSPGDFGYAVRGILYGSAGARQLPGVIHRAARTGDLSPFAQRYWERAAGFANFADGLHFSVFCAEDTPFIKDDEIQTLTEGTFLGRYLIDEYRGGCKEWARASIADDFFQPVTAPAPVLLVSGWFDPVTPPSFGEAVARHLPNSKHFVVRNEAHGAAFGCAMPALLYFLERATLVGLPSVCDGVTNLFHR
jgi:pimeloyl-ACP methyl ester carboxylesterase